MLTNRISPSAKFALIASFGGFVFGFDASVISGAIGFISEQFSLDEWQQGLVVSAPTLGAIIASFFAAFLSDQFGRRNTLIAVALLYICSAYFSAVAFDFESLVLARFIGGLAFCSLLITPMYIAEISLAKSRGRLVSINQLNIVIGLSVSYFSNYFLLQLGHSEGNTLTLFGTQAETWRWMLALELVPATVWFLALFLLPKSPRWLVLKNHHSDAKAVLKRLFSQTDVDAQLEEISVIDQKQSAFFTRLKGLFSGKVRLALLMGITLAIAQQISGINVIFFYAPVIFEQSGIGTDAAFLQASWIGAINVLFTLVALITIDQFGRKPLLIIGLVGVCVSMLICSYGFKQATYQINDKDVSVLAATHQALNAAKLSPLLAKVYTSDIAFKNAVIEAIGEQQFRQFGSDILMRATDINAALVLFGITAFVASFAMSLGPVMWVFFSEVFPSELRSIGISFLALINGLVSFLVQLVFPWELATLGAATTFLIYGVCALFALVLIVRFLPETKGQSLEYVNQAKVLEN
ncbi:sugar porter family MFS transporter [Pseudoalteromonas sp.]|uniref:sugar porter family MFS transporter n=1 Tax=Pseudoalteromonas sp. TaxID=53249 RepID=UPI0035649029